MALLTYCRALVGEIDRVQDENIEWDKVRVDLYTAFEMWTNNLGYG